MATLANTHDAIATPVAGRRRVDRGKLALVAGLVLPGAVVYGLFVLWPIVQAARFSLYRWKGLGPLTDNVGLANFERILRDDIFRVAVSHNLVIMALSLAIQLPLALGVALLVGRSMPGRTFFRTVFFLPYVLSEVVTGVLWSFIFRPGEEGLLNGVLGVVPGFSPRSWLGETGTVLLAIFAVITWKYFGLHMVLYVAGLQAIPRELEEAALIDGASPLRALWDVTIPLLGPTIRLSAFLSALGSLQFFDLVWAMTQGGPVNASDTMATYMFKYGFQRFALGYGAAVSLVIFGICFLFSLAYQRSVMRRDLDGAMT